GSGTGGGGGTLSGASPDQVRLRALLEYHAVRGVYRAADLRPGLRLRTINGNEVEVVAAQTGGLALANPAPATQTMGFGVGGLNIMPPAPIIQPDVIATNGIIHVIGGVLLP
ncbi:MAG: fasciclin domain-containing protein, partial [Acetobacteraceae bacterium]|nr:fasciclin domain-containing protein [Acetobacteraceae bacterium]